MIRAERYHFDRHRRRFTVARGMLRLILGRYSQQDPKALKFDYNAHGKPMLVNAQSLEFNLSHSADLALLAIGQQYSLGIDLEFFSARPYEGMASHSFSSQEFQAFLALPDFLKPQVFFHIWAQKEAFIKACGLGLSYPLKMITMPTFSPSNELIYDSIHQVEWQLSSFMPKVGCNAALCHSPEVTNIRYTRLAHIAEFDIS
ncbi:MAG: 4'-phosphopantetheinyl transferase superfamily protein [Tatlockia sp.]|nr:4'-phosphopantetheinyl transferase superfamily protein [Tatlockia sp.]